MRRLKLWQISLFVVLIALLFSGCQPIVLQVPPPAAPTATPVAAQGGTSVISAENFSAITIEERCLVELDTMLQFTGTISGQVASHVTVLVQNPCDDSPPDTHQQEGFYTGTFIEGTVNGIEGTFDLVGHFSADPGGENYAGEIIIVKGYDNLADLQGVLFETSENIVDTFYSGELHFDTLE